MQKKTLYYVSYQENQAKLFHGIIQFNPGELQKGQGTGLGLYITKGIVDSHKGHILVKSDGEGHGSTFTLLLPIAKHRIPKRQSQIKAVSSKEMNNASESEKYVKDQIYVYSTEDILSTVDYVTVQMESGSANTKSRAIDNSHTSKSYSYTRTTSYLSYTVYILKMNSNQNYLNQILNQTQNLKY